MFPQPVPSSSTGRHGFSLLELLVATSILLVLSTILMSVTGWVANVWSHAENQTHLRQTNRMIRDLLRADLEQVVLPLSRSDTTIFFAKNPAELSGSDLLHPHALVFHTALTTASDQSDIAAVAYFLREHNNSYNFCRAVIPAGGWTSGLDPEDPSTWPDAAPADRASNYQGLIAEGVLGMWVRIYEQTGTPPTESETPGATYDTRTSGSSRPSTVRIDFVLADKTAMTRLADGVETLPDSTATSAEAFVDSLSEALQSHVDTTSLIVPLTR